MRAVVGVQVIAGGTVTVLGEEAGSPGLRRRVGYLTQAPSVYGDLTVRDNVDYIAKVMGVGSDATDRAIATVDLTDHADARVENLSAARSRGPTSRARSSATPRCSCSTSRPSGLDPVLRRDLWDMFRAARRRRAAPCSCRATSWTRPSRCDRLLLLREGRILSDSTLPELLERTGAADAEQAFLALIDEADRGRGCGGMNPRITLRDRGPHPAPAARRPPHRRPDDRRAVRAARAAGLDLRRPARSTSSTGSARPCSASSRSSSCSSSRASRPCASAPPARWSGCSRRRSARATSCSATPSAFGAMAVVQAVVATGFAVWVCGLDIAGPLWLLVRRRAVRRAARHGPRAARERLRAHGVPGGAVHAGVRPAAVPPVRTARAARASCRRCSRRSRTCCRCRTPSTR